MDPAGIIDVINAFRSVYAAFREIKEDLEGYKRGGLKLFSSKKMEDIERRFKEPLTQQK